MSLATKEKLSALEMMQEAAFTELINKQSLEQLLMLENDRNFEYKGTRFGENEPILRFKQKKSDEA